MYVHDVCTHVCVYACMCMYAYMYASMHVCMHLCVNVCMHACMYFFAQVGSCWRSWVLLQHFACPPSAKRFLKFRASRSNAKQVYVGAPFSAFFAQVGSCWRSWALCWLILTLLGPILSPSCSKIAPRWPYLAEPDAKMGQDSAKMAQHSPT